jgi:hypothetical protein
MGLIQFLDKQHVAPDRGYAARWIWEALSDYIGHLEARLDSIEKKQTESVGFDPKPGGRGYGVSDR